MSTVAYTRNEVNTILNSTMAAREMLNSLLTVPADVVAADRPYWLAALDRVEEMIAIIEGK